MSIAKNINGQFRVIGAIILRDMRTRFGRTHLGYLIAIAWPLMHSTFILMAHALVNRVAPIGGDPVVFVSTGIIPYVMCFYPSRQMTFSVEHNKALLLFPIIRVSDIIFARAILEFLTSFLVAGLFFLIIVIFLGIDMTPNSPTEAITGILAAMYFGIAMGFVNTLIIALFKFWNAMQIVMMLVMYLSCGALFLPSGLSEQVQYYIWFNPLMHCVEWLRSAYYEDQGSEILSKSYVLIFSTALLFMGLLGERFVRGKILVS
jgi:capsular polysaccharide transport system permease protein